MGQERGRGTVDTLNRATWSRAEVVRTYAQIDGWTGDGGERAIFARVADQAREQPILDLGVGAGRTVPTMLAISHDYVGRWALRPRRLARQALDVPRSIRGYRRIATLTERGDGWAMLVSPAHGFGIVIHYITLAQALNEVRAAGFSADVEVYDMSGRSLDPQADARETAWLHLLARVPSNP